MQTVKNGRTILLGEDELEVRGYLEMALRCHGYSIESAQDVAVRRFNLDDRGTVVR